MRLLPPVRVSLFFFVIAIAVGFLARYFPEPLMGSVTPAVVFVAVIALASVLFMSLPDLRISRAARKMLYG